MEPVYHITRGLLEKDLDEFSVQNVGIMAASTINLVTSCIIMNNPMTPRLAQYKISFRTDQMRPILTAFYLTYPT